MIVNSWLTDDESRRISTGRRERYRSLLEAYRTFPENPRDVEELCAIEDARFDLARELFLTEDWDHFFVLFSSTDWLATVPPVVFCRVTRMRRLRSCASTAGSIPISDGSSSTPPTPPRSSSPTMASAKRSPFSA